MSVFLLLIGCASHVSWEVQPTPSYALPSLEVSVVAGDKECKRVADELARTLSARPGVLVRPDASVRLLLEGCEDQVDTTVELESANNPAVRLVGGAERRLRGPWVTEGTLELPRQMSLSDAVRRDLAIDLADQVAPLPATIRRTLYRDPEPGTARNLHNQAVDAERSGSLDAAIKLARQAYAANPTPQAMRYIEALQDHADAVGYALVDPAPK
jgi:hypothetical protein